MKCSIAVVIKYYVKCVCASLILLLLIDFSNFGRLHGWTARLCKPREIK